MPIYEYECSSCGHRLEAIQKMSDSPLADCPSCTEPSLRKLVSAAGFVLKGTGWYATDFKGSGKKGNGEGKGDGKGDATPEGKSEAKTSDKSTSTTTKPSASAAAD